ncbi:MAG: cobalamin-binding protein, partial [Deltaproteobacteria bacterium]|nr:cobalamin-binding protein [Deltaproteobacteria bacterium]
MAILDDIYQSVLKGDMNGATEGVNKALADNLDAAEIL